MLYVKLDGQPVESPQVIADVLDIPNLLEELAYRVAGIIKEDNESSLLAGLDRHGDPMPTTIRELTPSLSARLGDGPPLSPKRTGSRSISDFETEVNRISETQVYITGRWPNTPFFIYHAEGRAPGGITRDIIGIRESTYDRISEEARQFVADRMGGQS